MKTLLISLMALSMIAVAPAYANKLDVKDIKLSIEISGVKLTILPPSIQWKKRDEEKGTAKYSKTYRDYSVTLMEPFSEGLGHFRVIRSKGGGTQNEYVSGYINKRGEVVIEPQFQDAKPFSEGLAAVEVNEKWGFIDQEGRWIVEPKFDAVQDFQEGRAAAHLKNKDGGLKEWGIINRKGNWVVYPRYHKVYPFSEGFAVVVDRVQEGLIDRQGKTVVDTEVSTINSFKEGVTQVNLKTDPDSWVLMDKNCQVLF